ncbi:DUF3501 family protein [Aquincola sp. MAHUQ-54]|uniref:DUF3501 family protein n=1 Tax=Aquincola agrisoli TaxID=3119538 RepID=A0AAW9QCJ6_9BURK
MTTAARRSPLPLAELLAQDGTDPRTRYRLKQRLSTYTRARTVALGPFLRVVFEDDWTRRLQAARGRWSRSSAGDPPAWAMPAAPAGHAPWQATMQIALETPLLRAQWLATLIEAAHHLCLEIARGTRVPASVLAPCLLNEAGLAAQQPLRFDMPHHGLAALRAGKEPSLALACTHTRYSWRRVIPAPTIALLLGSAGSPAS